MATGKAKTGLSVLGTRTREILEEDLEPGEEVLFALPAAGGQALVSLSERILVFMPGYPPGAVSVISFPYSGIDKIHVTRGMTTSTIEIRSRAHGEIPNVVSFARGDLDTFRPQLEQLEKLVLQAKAAGSEKVE